MSTLKIKCREKSKIDWETYDTGYNMKGYDGFVHYSYPIRGITFLGWLARIVLVGIPSALIIIFAY